MLKRMSIMLVAVLLLVLALGGYKFMKIKAGMAQFATSGSGPPSQLSN